MAKNEVKNNKNNAATVKKDFNWYLKAAEQGDAGAQLYVGLCYDGGIGAKKDKNKAFNWYLKAAEQNLAEAQCLVGICYKEGWGIEGNNKKAFEWFMKSAEQGNDRGQCAVGLYYDKGWGVEENKEKAFEWFMKSAEQGYDIAQYFVGVCYDVGRGVEKNEEKAFEWFMKSAEHGYTKAQKAVELFYEHRKGRGENRKAHCGVFKDGLENTKSELLTAVYKIKKEESNTSEAELFKRLDDMAKDIAEIKTKLSKNNTQIKPEKLTAFVIMQFGEDFDALYNDVIIPVCKELGYGPVRADNCYGEIILEDIVKGISDASLVIADITKDNPNVFYELGYAHALKKPTILLADQNQREKFPFDTQGYRTIFYQNTIRGKREIENRLREHMEKYQEKSCIEN